jgi:hypothetical protein
MMKKKIVPLYGKVGEMKICQIWDTFSEQNLIKNVSCCKQRHYYMTLHQTGLVDNLGIVFLSR